MSVEFSARHCRQWAKSQGISVGERGRLHPDVIERYLNRDKDEAVEIVIPSHDPEGNPRPSTATGKANRHPRSCEFCRTGHHQHCPGTILNGAQVTPRIWTCKCWKEKEDPDLHPIGIDRSGKI